MLARRLTTFIAAGTIVLAACGGSDSAEPAAGAEVETGSPVTPPASGTTDDGAVSAETTPADTVVGETIPAETVPAGTPPTQVAPGSTAAPAPEPTDAPVAVPTALDFTARTLDGSEIEMGQYAGRPVLLWFWAPW